MKLLSDLLYDARILEVRGTTHVAVEHIAIDSRKVQPLGLFVAIEGASVDGHDFIDQAINLGASCIVCERMPEQSPEHVTVIQVKSSVSALGHIASAFHDHPSRDMKVVAVTGTNGKTTTVTLLHQLYRLLDRKVGILGTVENRIVDRVVPATHTTPDALSLQALLRDMADAGCTHVFMEASSHAIVQERMTGTHLTGAVFTNITHDHLDYHGDFNGYIKAKKQLFDRLPASSFAAVNADDPHAEDMVADTKAKVVTMAIQGVADERARLIENQITGLVLHLDGQELYSQLVGGFNASNLLAVYVVSKLLRTDKINALTQMSLLQPQLDDLSGSSQGRHHGHCRLRPHSRCLGQCAENHRARSNGRRKRHHCDRMWGRPGRRKATHDGQKCHSRIRQGHPDERQPPNRRSWKHPQRHGTRLGPH